MSDTTPDAGRPVLDVRDLRVAYHARHGSGAPVTDAVRGVSLVVHPGEVVALVGESGSGKSTTAHAVVGLLPEAGDVVGGSVALGADERTSLDLTRLGVRGWRQVRGARIGLVPQDPGVALNPVVRIGDQVAEVLRIHGLAGRRDARARAVEILRSVGLDAPEARARQYPHELSGGMRQRVLIGIALACEPELVIADEPTSALDVTVQAKVLDLLDELTAKTGSAVLFITHDLAVAADRADRVVVMKDGEVVEQGPTAQVLGSPEHPYTRELLVAAPSLAPVDAPAPAGLPAPVAGRATGHVVAPSGDATVPTRAVGSTRAVAVLPDAEARREEAAPPALVVARGLVKEFRLGGRRAAGVVRAVDEVSFEIPRGQAFALVGESGSGKSTTARLVLDLTRPDAGSVRLDGVEVAGARGAALRDLRRRTQLVHQNPYASLDPRFTVAQIVDEPLRAHRVGDARERRTRVAELLDQVQLPATFAGRRPEELSGGQRQRVAIARALALDPELLVLDEPTSALDVSVQARVLDLLAGLRAERGLTYLFISHDLAVVRQVAERVGVLRRGRLVETGLTQEVFAHPRHEYTAELVGAVPGRGALAPAPDDAAPSRAARPAARPAALLTTEVPS